MNRNLNAPLDAPYIIISILNASIFRNQYSLEIPALHIDLVVKLIVVIIRAPTPLPAVKLIVVVVIRAPAPLPATSVVPIANTSSVAADTTVGAVAVPVTRPVSRAWTRPKDASRGTALEAAAAVTVGLALTPLLTRLDDTPEGFNSS